MADYKRTGSNKRRKRSGLTSIQLSAAHESLLLTIQSFNEGMNEDAQAGEGQDNETAEWTDGIHKGLERLRTLFEARLKVPKPRSPAVLSLIYSRSICRSQAIMGIS